MTITVLHFPEDARAAARVGARLDAVLVPIKRHVFPDQEVSLSFAEALPSDCAIFCTLDRPNAKYLPLIFAAEATRERGAKQVGLITPYLPYMRQDTHFADGDVISARLFAAGLSRHFDWLVTMDAHLHRIHRLEDVFTMRCEIAHAAPALAKWIQENVPSPALIGPDSESEQWVKNIAQLCSAPYTTLKKSRLGDSNIAIADEQFSFAGKKPVLIDDIISSGETMAKAVEMIRNKMYLRPYCLAVHGIFAPGAFERLTAAGPQGTVTTNSVPHPSNQIDISGNLAAAVSRAFGASVENAAKSAPSLHT